jgi:hypothetical protein
MKIGWTANARLRHKGGHQFERYMKSLESSQIEALFIVGNYSGSAHDNLRYIRDSTSHLSMPVFFTLGNQDFRKERKIHETVEATQKWVDEQNREQTRYIYLANVGLLKMNKETVIIGVDGFYDGVGVTEEGGYNEDFDLIGDFAEVSNDKAKTLDLCNRLAKTNAEILAEKLAEAHKERGVKNVIIFTNTPGSEKSLLCGGSNTVPEGARGYYVNRHIYPTIAPLVAKKPKVKHFVIAASPLCNNSVRVLPNLKEFTCIESYSNAQGQKAVALHTIEV